jgi:membrane associated rhomboid family serine protease
MSSNVSTGTLRQRCRTSSRRLVRWLTDADNQLWGFDERERSLLYESHTATLFLAVLATPTVAAIVIALFGRDAFAPVMIASCAPVLLASLVVWPHQRSEQLPDAPRRKVSWRRSALSFIAVVPLVAVRWWQSSDPRTVGDLAGALIGALSGVAAVLLFTAYRRRHPRDDG